jgi:hypothetical protein
MVEELLDISVAEVRFDSGPDSDPVLVELPPKCSGPLPFTQGHEILPGTRNLVRQSDRLQTLKGDYGEAQQSPAIRPRIVAEEEGFGEVVGRRNPQRAPTRDVEDMGYKFLDYLGTEETNLLINVANHQEEFQTFNTLDRVFTWAMENMSVPTESVMIADLYLFAHTCLYTSISSILRCHEEDAFSSTRKAIEAALHAYRIRSKPESVKLYIEGAKEFEKIKQTLGQDRSTPPIVRRLMDIHGYCCKWASHADARVILSRISVLDERTEIDYFDTWVTVEKYRFAFYSILRSFLTVFLVFHEILIGPLLKTKNEDWRSDVATLQEQIAEKICLYTPKESDHDDTPAGTKGPCSDS